MNREITILKSGITIGLFLVAVLSVWRIFVDEHLLSDTLLSACFFIQAVIIMLFIRLRQVE